MDKRRAAMRHGKVKAAPSTPATRRITAAPEHPTARRVLVVGGGHLGTYTALHLQRRLKPELRRGEVEIVVVTPDPCMTHRAFLPEAAAGSISPRHVVVPLRRVLHRCRLVIGAAQSIEHAKRKALLTTLATQEEGTGPAEIGYDELVLAPGPAPRTPPIPGLAAHGIELTTVDQAIGLRNHVIEQMDIAATTRDPALRAAALTFVFVGSGYPGVGALGELEDMARHAARSYRTIRAEDMKWILVADAGRILPEADPDVANHTLRELRKRNIDVRLHTRLESCGNRIAVLDDGARIATRTLVWTAGATPHPVLAASDLPLDEHGRLICTAQLAIAGVSHAWSAGDVATVSDRTDTEPATERAPTAQHAARQAKALAANIIATLRGRPLKEYAHSSAGSTVSLGLHKGVAQLYGRTLRGYPAWFIHRLRHLSRVPTVHRKARTLAEWTLSGLFTREIVSLGSLEHPRAKFEPVAGKHHPENPKRSS